MENQYFSAKELYQATLRARSAMAFGSRSIAAGEPVLYFDHINLAQMDESVAVQAAKGGYGNPARVLWEKHENTTFSLTEGVMNDIGMSLFFSAQMAEKQSPAITYVSKREGPFTGGSVHVLQQTPVTTKPIFCYEYDLESIQKKESFTLDNKNLTITDSSASKEYIIDYYYGYSDNTIIYTANKERFNGDFSFEGKFYTQDENDGIKVTNILFMPRVRVVSNLNLRLGEGVNPIAANFQLLAMPENTDNSKDVMFEVTRLSEDIDADI